MSVIDFFVGDDADRSMTIYLPNTFVPADLTSIVSATLVVKNHPIDDDVFSVLSLPGDLAQAVSGIITFHFTAAQTATMRGLYWYRVYVIDTANKQRTVANGPLIARVC